jgi:hypothetical protein
MIITFGPGPKPTRIGRIVEFILVNSLMIVIVVGCTIWAVGLALWVVFAVVCLGLMALSLLTRGC